MSTQPKLSVEEYLEIERKADFKSEFHGGEMFAMAGASERHNVIGLNLAVALRTRLRGRCRVFHADMRVAVGVTGLYTYPDIVVGCGEREWRDAHVDALENPNFIAEVLSPSTEASDRGLKFRHYRTVDSLQEYMLVSQDRASVELYRRSLEGDWTYSAIERSEDHIRLQSLDCRIPLAEVYEDVEFT